MQELIIKFIENARVIDIMAVGAMMWIMYSRIEKKFDKIEKKFDRIDEKFDRLEAKIDARFDKVDERFDKLESKVEDIDKRVCRIEGGLSSNSYCGLITQNNHKKKYH